MKWDRGLLPPDTVELLEKESDQKLESLEGLLKESWSMLDLYLARTAEIVHEKRQIV